MGTFNWLCPFCNKWATIVQNVNISENGHNAELDTKYGRLRLISQFISCPNPDCKEFSLSAYLFSLDGERRDVEYAQIREKIKQWQLIPDSSAQVFPDYVPQQIRDDYVESCRIKNLSPKASATLARRCLQGMIRNFWNIKRGNLNEEIKALDNKVDSLIWKAIDAVRSIGNIGAHMEKDVNLIIDVEPDEAQQLIQLIEILIRDWYIARHEKEESLKKIVALGELKNQQKKHTDTNKKEPMVAK